MADFTAADVKRLRDLTGAGMMDCKKALTEADGDFDKSVELLRIKGAKDVGKRAGRTAANGLIAQSGNVMLELNCETDFVAKNGAFIEFAQALVEHADAARPADLDALLASSLTDGRAVSLAIEEEAAKIGEKLVLGRYAVLDDPIAIYLHRKSPDLPPAVGVMATYSGTDTDAVRAAAMQVAAMRPKYLTRDEVPADIVENERRVAEETAREAGKPEQALPKIVEGRVNAYFKDFVLLEQASVTDNKKTVKQLLDAAGVTITKFVRFEVGQS